MAETTRAAVLVEVGQPLQILELALPELAPGQVLVDIAYSGVCRSQLLETSGARGPDRFLPHTLGHEGSGTVLGVGPGVTKVKAGDPVVLSWIKGRGADAESAVYQSDRGPVNSGAVSTFMTRAVVSENRTTPVSSALPAREAALLGCAVPTGAGSVFNLADVRPGSTVAVLGVGGIGLAAIAAARLQGARMLIAVDRVNEKLELARRLGATHVINACKVDPLERIRELTGGLGVDRAIEAVGRPEIMELGLAAVRERGGVCVLTGNVAFGERISIDPFDLIRGKRLVGTWGGETDPDRDIPRYADLALRGLLDLGALITREVPLSEVNGALEDLEAGRVARVLIRPAEGEGS